MDFQDRNASSNNSEIIATDDAPTTPVGRSSRSIVVQPDANNIVNLPEGASIDTIVADGRDLIIQADGVVYVIPDGAIIVPQLVVGGVTVPALNLAALLVGNEPVPALGPELLSSGGNFETTPGDIQAAYGLGDLLPYTELAFPQPQDEEIIPQPVDREPTVIVVTQDNPAGAVNATAQVNEAGLPARTGEPAGTDSTSDSETTTGTINYSAPDGTSAVLINGVAITAIGQKFVSPDGILTITSIAEGAIGFSYTLSDNLLGRTEDGFFEVTVIDRDGDRATATLAIKVIDDVPLPVNDADLIDAANPGPATGNVITGVGTLGNTADNVGADNAKVSHISSAADGTVAHDGSGAMVIRGDHGTLEIKPSGDYTYTRFDGNPLQDTDVFTYRLTDDDGSPNEATLTITIVDHPAAIVSVPEVGDGTLVNESGLPVRGIKPPGSGELLDDGDGTNNTDQSESTSGTISFTAPDGVAEIAINGTIVATVDSRGNVTLIGNPIDLGDGTLLITAVDPGAGTISYEFTLGDNTLGERTSVNFVVTVVDTDGDSGDATVTIRIQDDQPLAANDFATQDSENTAITIKVFENDIPGADGVRFDAIAAVPDTLSGGGMLVYNGDGTFTYIPSPGEEGALTFDYVITDGDGSPSIATVTITLQQDSIPAVVNVIALSDDDGLSGSNPASDINDIDANAGESPLTASEATFSGKINVTFGNDTGSVSFANLAGTTGTVGIETVNYAWNAGGHTLTATGPRGVLFTVTLDPDGTFVLTQIDNVLHEAGNGELSAAGVVLSYRASDSDGDIDDSGTLTIMFNDDAPTAYADTNLVTEGDTVDGNVLTDGTADEFGADGPTGTSAAGGVIGFAAGNDISVAATGTPGTNIESALGFLKLDADGKYSYMSKANSINVDAKDVFTYTIRDADGDISTTTLTISITNVVGQISDNGVLVDESGLDATGSQIVPDGEFDTDGQITVIGATGTLVYTLTGPAVGTFGTLVLDSATGAYSYTLRAPISDTTGDDGRNTILGAESFGYEVKDTDGNLIGTGIIRVDVVDDIPTVTANPGFGGSLTVDESNFAIDATGLDLTGAFTVSVGADRPGTTVYTLALSAQGADSGLDDTASGANILLYTNGNTVEGRVGGVGGAVAFVITNVNGVLSLDQRSAVKHPDATNPNDQVDIDDGMIFLRATVTDADNDVASANLDIGAALNFNDDGPTLNTATVSVRVEEDELATGITDGDAFNTIATGSLASLVNFGADGVGSFGFSLAGFVNPNITSGGTAVKWGVSANGLTLVGYTGATIADGQVITVAITNASTGAFTVTLKGQVDHLPNIPANDDGQTLSLALGSAVVAKDGDGDPVTLGGTAALTVVIEDDIPTVTANPGFGGSLTVDESNFAIDATGLDLTGAFTVSVGADRPGTTVYTLALSAQGADSGLDDTASGANILLYTNGNTVEGRVGGVGGAVAFVITNVNGVLSLDQRSAVKHPDATNPNDQVDIDDGMIFLRATVTDADNDVASANLDIGAALNFNDDGPTLNTATVSVRVEEDELATGITDGDAFNTIATGSLASLVNFGADGVGSFGFSLAGFVNPNITSGGTAVKWGVSANGLTLVGYTGATIADGQVITVAITNASTGAFTVTLKGQVDHLPNIPANDDGQTLSLALGSAVVAKDGDGDPVTLGGTAALTVVIEDDIPTVTANPGFGGSLTVDESNFAIDATGLDLTGAFTVSVGADRPGTTVYTLALSAQGADSGLDDTASGANILLYTNGNTVEGRVGGVGGAVAFVITNVNGVLSLDQRSAVKHPDATNPNDQVDIDDGMIFLRATVTDADNDVASANLDIGAALNFNDDGPLANNDVDSVTEDTALIADGNVLTGIGGNDANTTDGVADVPGADGGKVGGVAQGDTNTVLIDGATVGTVVAGSFGTITIAAGGGYTYTLTNGLPAVQALGVGQTLTDTFTYTLVDGDGDAVTATIKITINGTNDAPTIQAATALVSEEGLPGGNPDTVGSPSDNTNAASFSGTMVVSDLDGDALTVALGNPGAVLTANGAPVTWTGVGTQLLVGSANGQPVVTVTIDNSGNYTVTLSDGVDHIPILGEGLKTFTVPVTVSDGSLSNSANLAITIEDDSPVIGAFSPSANTVDNVANDMATGTFGYTPGGDGHGSFNITGPAITGVTYSLTQSDADNNGQNDTATLTATAGGQTLFTLQVDDTGNYKFTLVTPDAATSEVLSLAALKAGGPGFRELGDDLSTPINENGRIEFTSNGTGVNANNNAFGVSNAFIDPGEFFVAEFHNPGIDGDDAPNTNPEFLSAVSFDVVDLKNSPGNVGPNVTVKWTATNTSTGQVESGTTTITATGQLLIDPAITFNQIRIENFDDPALGNDGARFSISTATIFKTILPQDKNLDFTITATDQDGDVSSVSNLSILIDATSPVALDLDGNGVEFLSLADGVTHDYGNGLVSTSWVGPNDGLLGRMTDNGVDVAFRDDAAGAKTDLEGLRLAFDSNGDGQLSAADAAFAQFGVWQDANSNGIVDAGEFRSLTDAGIISINLTSDGIAYGTADGDVAVHGTGSYAKADGSIGQLADASFATDAVAAMNQRGTQIAGVNAVIAALVMPEMLVAMEPLGAEQSSVGSTFGSEPQISNSGLSPMVVPEQMALASDHFLGSAQAGTGSVSSQSIGHVEYESMPLNGLHDPVSISHSDSNVLASGPVFAFGAGAGASAVVAPSVEGVQLMDALLALGQGAAGEGQATAAVGDTLVTLDLLTLQEAFADVVDSHAVDAIVDHFAGDLAQGSAVSATFDAGILNVAVGDAPVFFGLQSPVDMAAEDMSAIAASA